MTSGSRMVVVAAASAALVGVTGEALLLRHELIDCLPYKEMAYPPAQFFHALGNVGAISVVALSVVVVFVLVRRAPLGAPPVLAAVAPLLFLAMKAISTQLWYGHPPPLGSDLVSEGRVEGGFASMALLLSLFGAAVGAACSAAIDAISVRFDGREHGASAI